MKRTILTISLVLMLLVNLVVPTTAASTNLAEGKSYTMFGYNNQGAYLDVSGNDLTDGVYAKEAVYYDNAFVGFNTKSEEMEEIGASASEIIIDLEKKADITKFSVEVLTAVGAGIKAASVITAFVSDDGSVWTEVDDLDYGDADVDSDGIFNPTLEKAASGRYVKYAFEHKTTWSFVSEVEVWGKISDDTTTPDPDPDPDPEPKPDPKPDPKPPATSDYSFIVYGFMAIVSLSGVIVVIRRK